MERRSNSLKTDTPYQSTRATERAAPFHPQLTQQCILSNLCSKRPHCHGLRSIRSPRGRDCARPRSASDIRSARIGPRKSAARPRPAPRPLAPAKAQPPAALSKAGIRRRRYHRRRPNPNRTHPSCTCTCPSHPYDDASNAWKPAPSIEGMRPCTRMQRVAITG